MSVLASYTNPLPGCSKAGVNNNVAAGQAGARTSPSSPVPLCLEAVSRDRIGVVTMACHSPGTVVHSCGDGVAPRPSQVPGGRDECGGSRTKADMTALGARHPLNTVHGLGLRSLYTCGCESFLFSMSQQLLATWHPHHEHCSSFVLWTSSSPGLLH